MLNQKANVLFWVIHWLRFHSWLDSYQAVDWWIDERAGLSWFVSNWNKCKKKTVILSVMFVVCTPWALRPVVLEPHLTLWVSLESATLLQVFVFPLLIEHVLCCAHCAKLAPCHSEESYLFRVQGFDKNKMWNAITVPHRQNTRPVITTLTLN